MLQLSLEVQNISSTQATQELAYICGAKQISNQSILKLELQTYFALYCTNSPCTFTVPLLQGSANDLNSVLSELNQETRGFSLYYKYSLVLFSNLHPSHSHAIYVSVSLSNSSSYSSLCFLTDILLYKVHAYLNLILPIFVVS